jgi:hypothetical protein
VGLAAFLDGRIGRAAVVAAPVTMFRCSKDMVKSFSLSEVILTEQLRPWDRWQTSAVAPWLERHKGPRGPGTSGPRETPPQPRCGDATLSPNPRSGSASPASGGAPDGARTTGTFPISTTAGESRIATSHSGGKSSRLRKSPPTPGSHRSRRRERRNLGAQLQQRAAGALVRRARTLPDGQRRHQLRRKEVPQLPLPQITHIDSYEMNIQIHEIQGSVIRSIIYELQLGIT